MNLPRKIRANFLPEWWREKTSGLDEFGNFCPPVALFCLQLCKASQRHHRKDSSGQQDRRSGRKAQDDTSSIQTRSTGDSGLSSIQTHSTRMQNNCFVFTCKLPFRPLRLEWDSNGIMWSREDNLRPGKLRLEDQQKTAPSTSPHNTTFAGLISTRR